MDIQNIRVGDNSSYSFLAPYDSILSDKTVYEVTNLSTLKSLLNKKYEPLDTIYKLYGMSEVDFEDDLSVNMIIVEFTLGDKSFYVPLDRITDKEVDTNVHYSERLIGIKLGFIPDSEDLSLLLSDIDLLIKDTLGIEASINDMVVSAVVSQSEVDHLARESIRDSLKGEPGNYKKLYYDLKTVQAYTINRLKSLEFAELNTRL